MDERNTIQKINGHVLSGVLFLLAFFGEKELYAQSYNLHTQLTPEVISLGDTASLNIQLAVPSSVKVVLPQPQDSLNRYIEINQIKIDSAQRGNQKTYRQNITLTSFEEGTFLVPALVFTLDGKTVQSQAKELEVKGLQLDSNAQQLAPIKTILPIHFSWYEKNKKYVAYFLVAIVILGLLLWVLYSYIKHRRKPVEEVVLLPPYEEALQRLAELKAKKYLDQGCYAVHYTELSYLFRRYLQRRFSFPALSLLTDDLVATLVDENCIPLEQQAELKQFFDQTKLAKFAQKVPTDHQPYLDWVERWIKETQPLVEDQNQNYAKL